MECHQENQHTHREVPEGEGREEKVEKSFGEKKWLKTSQI